MDGRDGFEGWSVSNGLREVRDVEVFVVEYFQSGMSGMVGNGDLVGVDGMGCKRSWEEIKFD